MYKKLPQNCKKNTVLMQKKMEEDSEKKTTSYQTSAMQ